MNLEFAGRLNKPELIIKDFKHWVIILKEEPTTLGHSVIILKSNKPNFKDITSEEMKEFPEVCKWFEEKTKTLFGAEKWNYCAMMMKEEFVHFQAVPRYSDEINKYNLIWKDICWPKRPDFSKLDIDYNILLKVANEMKG